MRFKISSHVKGKPLRETLGEEAAKFKYVFRFWEAAAKRSNRRRRGGKVDDMSVMMIVTRTTRIVKK